VLQWIAMTPLRSPAHEIAMVRSQSGLYLPAARGHTDSASRKLSQQESGLIAPDPEERSAADALLCAPTSADLKLAGCELEEIVDALRVIPFEAGMLALSALAAELYHHGRDAQYQLGLSAEFHDSDMRWRIERFLSEDPSSHVVFDPRHVLALQRLMILHASDETRAVRPAELHQLTRRLLDLSEALPTSEPEGDGQEVVDLEGWNRYLAQSSAWYHEPYVLEALARAYTMFVELASEPEFRIKAGRIELENRLLDAYGLGLSEQIGVGLACATLTHAISPEVQLAKRFVVLERGFLSAGALADREQQAVDLLSSTRAQLRTCLLQGGDTPQHTAWDHSALEASPFLLATSGQLRLISPRLLVSWMSRGLHYRLLDAAGDGQEPPAARQARGRFLTFTGDLGEEYVRRVVRSSLADAERSGAVRVYGEVEYYVTKKRHDSPDVAIAAGPDLVLIEVYSGRMSRAARTQAGSRALIEFIDRSTAQKLCELADRTRDLLAQDLRYEDVAIAEVRRIWPVLVLAGDGLIESPLLWDYLQENAPRAFISDERVRRPVICDLDDLEPLLALCEDGRHLPDLLGGFLGSEYRNQPPRNWIWHNFKGNHRASFVERQFRVGVDAAKRSLFAGPCESSVEDERGVQPRAAQCKDADG
jgi:hypothetical protein